MEARGQQLLYYLRQAPAGLPDGPAGDAAEAITGQLVQLLVSERALAAHAAAPAFTSLPRSETVRAATLLAEIGDVSARWRAGPSRQRSSNLHSRCAGYRLRSRRSAVCKG